MKQNQMEVLDNLVENILKTVVVRGKNTNPMMNIGYGLYLATAVDTDNRDCGCIINTLNQITSKPNIIAISVNKKNYTCEVIDKKGKFNISILTEETPLVYLNNLVSALVEILTNLLIAIIHTELITVF